MKFVFVCTAQNKVFDSAAIPGGEAAGNKILGAKVVLDMPCPFCGEKHVYHAGGCYALFRLMMT